jgi:hypothetical protein
MLREIIAVYSENLMKSINILCDQNAELRKVKALPICSYIQCSKWAGIYRYTVPELLFVPEFHSGTYESTYLPFSIFLTVCPYIAFKKYTGAYRFIYITGYNCGLNS